MRIKLDNFYKYLLIFAGIFLPTQAFFVLVLHLPSVFQMLYIFLIAGIIALLFTPLKQILLSQNKFVISLWIFLLIALMLSCIHNYTDLFNHGLGYYHYTSKYFSSFWDTIPMRLFNWGFLRPFLFFLYVVILFVLLKTEKLRKILLKTLIIVALVSSIYSVYQIIATFFCLPFGSLFSGHNGNEIFIAPGVRRCEGIFYEAGPQATFLSPIFCVLLTQLFEKNLSNVFFSKTKTLVAFMLVSIALFFTFSPIAFLTFVLTPLILTIINIKKIRHFKIKKKYFYLILILGCAFVTIIVMGIFKIKNSMNFDVNTYMLEKIAKSLYSMDDPFVYTNADSRSVRNYVGICEYKDNKLFGVGPGAAINYYYRYAPFTTWNLMLSTEGVINTHIKMLCETGIVGFIPYLLLILYPLFLCIKKYKSILKSKNNLLIQGLLIGYILYIFLSYQATLEFFKSYFWMIYILLITEIKKEKYYIKNLSFKEEK